MPLTRIAPVVALMAAACTGEVVRPPAEQVATWVPMQAEFRTVAAGVESRGRFLRHRNGSTRRETLARDATPAFVTIENRATAEFHAFSAGTWTTQPLVVRRPGPPPASEFASATPHPARVEGYLVVRATTLLGSSMLRAPALNYFALVEEHPDPPLRIEFLAVTEDMPADALFAPPAGATVARLPWAHTISR